MILLVGRSSDVSFVMSHWLEKARRFYGQMEACRYWFLLVVMVVDWSYWMGGAQQQAWSDGDVLVLRKTVIGI